MSCFHLSVSLVRLELCLGEVGPHRHLISRAKAVGVQLFTGSGRGGGGEGGGQTKKRNINTKYTI